MLAVLITSAHFSVSSANSFAKSVGDNRHNSKIGHSRSDFCMGKASIDLAIEPVDDLLGVSFGAPTRFQLLAS